MKTIGLIGGMSWESSLEYYRLLNLSVRKHRGGHHTAKILMSSVDFEEIRGLQCSGDWNEAARLLSAHAMLLENAGADLLAICTNTMHKVAPQVQDSLKIPLVHIADTVSQAAIEIGAKRVGLLGTLFTMEDGFYSNRLAAKGLETLLPEKSERQFVHRTIFEELCKSQFLNESRQVYLSVIDSLKRQGAEAVILGCTEIGLLVKPEDTTMPLLDTTRIHVDALVNLALA